MHSLIQMVAAGGCLCKNCHPPVKMEKKDWSDHTICDPAQVWVRWECPKCDYWIELRFDDDYTVDPPSSFLVVRIKEEKQDHASDKRSPRQRG